MSMKATTAKAQPTEASISTESTLETELTVELSASQRLLWLGQQLAPESPLYNMAFLFQFDGEICPVHFQSAWSQLVAHSDTLRTVITTVDGEPKQHVLARVNDVVPIIKLGTGSAPETDLSNTEDVEKLAYEWAAAQAKRQFNLAEQLFDTALIHLGSNQYIWYLNQHHLTTDITSVQNIYQKLGDFYHQARTDTLASTTVSPIVQPPRRPSELAINYWKSISPSPVPLYQRTATIVSPQTRRVFCELGPERTARLKQLALNSEAIALTPALSLFNLVASIFLAYLHRISNSDYVGFATPAHGRINRDLKAAIGCFIELFPLATNISANETFASLLTKVNAASGNMLRHAQPGASEFATSRDVNVVLNFINAQVGPFDEQPVRATWIHPGAGDPRHHLRLQVHDFDSRGSLQLHFDFNCDLFEPTLQDRAPSHFLALVDAILSDRHRPIAGVELVSEAERLSLHALGQSKAVQVTQTVTQSFEAQARRTPAAIAVIDRPITLTYHQLNQQANQLACYLQQQGVTQQTPVAICLQRSPAMLVAIFGILKAGGTYVPLDPSHPKERIAHILADTQAHCAITTAQLSQHIPPLTPAILLDQVDLPAAPDENPNIQTDLDQLAYILYTSGSTGKPKGVMISHKSLANYVQWGQQQYVRHRTLAFPLFSPLTFDLTVTSIYLPLLSGGQVVIYPETDEAIDLSLQRIFTDNAVDVIKLTPSHLSLVQGMTIGSRVKTLILGGEDLKTTVADAITAASDHPLEIYNEYGPTEATVGCMVHQFTPAPDAPNSVSVGKPVAGTKLYLLDERLNSVPQGAVGEIVLGGPGLARGYLNRAELTAEQFIDYQGERLYRTGDRGRWEADGSLSYLGRGDRQVKVNGHRIELGEVEAVLTQHPGITMGAVQLVQPTARSAAEAITYCSNCGIASNYPGIEFDADGVCNICHTYETYRHRAEQYFKSLPELQSRLDKARQRKQSRYDCMMLLSGGKDSTYALAQLVHMGYKVFAFTLDNGYISEEAKANIRRVVQTLNVEHEFGSTPAMNAIFVDSLDRHCNVCNGCFKTIYTLSMQLAYERGIPCIVTGLSRGQFFETRLTEEWFTNLFGQAEFDVDQIDATIVEARKVYHRTDDAVSRLMDVAAFQSDDIFEAVEVIDFYRYCDVELNTMLAFLQEQMPWIRPSDTGRSTNCLINNVGIHIHTLTRGYHNYALPYSWDVRMGHKTVDAAIDELNDAINLTDVEQILQEIGYDTNRINQSQLAAYYVAADQQHIPTSELREFLARHLPRNLVPAYFIPLEKMPLTGNGKVDFAQLPDAQAHRPDVETTFIAPQTTIEKTLAQLWQQVLKINRIGIHDNFFNLGGDSIMAIQIAARISEFGFGLSPNQLFQHPTVAQLAKVIAPEVMPSDEPVAGIVPLMPIQQAFFEQQPATPEQFTQTVVLDIRESLVPERLASAIDYLIQHHDSLRLRYIRTKQGWEQSYQATVPAVNLTQLDLSEQTISQQTQTIAHTKTQLQTQLHLEQGDLVRAALFQLGDRDRLVIIIHQLAIYAVSWLTLLKDLETVYRQLDQGQPPLLPLKTSSFQAWAQGLEQVSIPQAEQDYWLAPPVGALASLTRATSATHTSAQSEIAAPVQHLSRQLSSALTQKLLQHADRPQEILLTALALAVQQQTNQTTVRIDLEGHGREATVVKGIRLVRSIGWFTSRFPVTLRIDTATPLSTVKQTLHQVPQNGIGYGILRYYRGDREAHIQQQLQAQPQAEISFNYLGQLEQRLPRESLFRFAEPLQFCRSQQYAPSHLIEISAVIHQDQLHIDWHGTGVEHRALESIADRMLTNINELLGQTAASVSAADFPLAKLNQKKFNKLKALLDQSGTTEDT